MGTEEVPRVRRRRGSRLSGGVAALTFALAGVAAACGNGNGNGGGGGLSVADWCAEWGDRTSLTVLAQAGIDFAPRYIEDRRDRYANAPGPIRDEGQFMAEYAERLLAEEEFLAPSDAERAADERIAEFGSTACV